MPRIGLKGFARAAACTAVLAACGLAVAAPPADRGPASQGRSTVDRALESRARLADRAADPARSATANAGAGAATNDAIGRAQAEVAGRANATPNGVGLGVGGEAGGHAGAASKGVGLGIGGDAKGHASPQAGTGRLSRDIRGLNGRTVDRGRETTSVAAGASGPTTTRSGLRLGWLKRSERAPVQQVSGETTGSARVNGRVTHNAERPQFDLSRADRLLAHRLAQIERMRDRAVEADDEELLRQADRLEVVARAQYSQRTDGETSVGVAVKTYNASLRDTRDATDDDTTTDPGTDDGTATDPGTTTDPGTDGDSTPVDSSDSTPVDPTVETP